MRKIILSLLIICGVSPLLRAQNFELSIGANTGWFAYSGPGTAVNTVLYQGSSASGSDVLNSYGNKYAFSYGAFLQPQYVFKSGFMVGLQGSYNILRSKDGITTIYPYELYFAPNYYGSPPAQPASGSDIMQTQVIGINPYIGYRVQAGNIKIDIMPGMSFGFDLTSREKGEARYTGQDTLLLTTNNKQPTQHADVQLKLGIGASWQRWSLVGSYAYGLTDLEPAHEVVPEPLGASSESTDGYNSPYGKIHSRLFQLGLSYRLFAGKIK